MIKSRKAYELVQGDGNVMHKTVIESHKCVLDTEESRFIQLDILKSIASYPEITLCGGKPFTSFNMKHDSEKWVLTFLTLEVKAQT